MLVLDALSVGCDTVDGDATFVLGEELGGRDVIGEEDERDDTPGYAYRSENQEHIHPSWETSLDVSDCVSYQATKHGCYSVCAVVDFESERLLGGCVPHRYKENEARINGGL